MPSLNDALRNLYGETQLPQLDRVRNAMLDDPTVLDNRKEKDSGKEGISPSKERVSRPFG